MLDVYGMPIKGTGDDGDSMLWAGLMCAVGERGPIQGIRMCQTRDGRVWRSPNRVNNQPENSFSRDMALGFILYLQASKNHYMAQRWVEYIQFNGGLFPASESTDTRHIPTPSLWWLMSYAGVDVPWYYRITRGLLGPWQKIEARFSPKGYATHLQGVGALILSIAKEQRQTDIGKILHAKEPYNPFFAWLAGKDELAVSLWQEFKTIHDASPGDGSQWGWERTDSEEAWRDSMGWDFLFMEKLFQLKL